MIFLGKPISACFILGGLMCTLMPIKASNKPPSYGESCNVSSPCDVQDPLLTCNAGVCDCIKPEFMTYEPAQALSSIAGRKIPGRCVAKAGEKCRVQLRIAAAPGTAPSVQNVTYPCATNAECSTSGTCLCTKGFENRIGVCVKLQEYLQPCGPQIRCNKGLVCTSGVCRCDADTSVWDWANGRCVGKVDSECINKQCTLGAECRDGICSCRDGFDRSDENTCVPQVGYGDKCKDDDQCGSDTVSRSKLICLDSKCTCDPTSFVYAQVQRYRDNNFSGMNYTLCAPKPGEKCTERLCAPGAYCHITDAGINVREVCKCLPDRQLSNVTGMCMKGFGQTCMAGECIEGLVCKDNSCSCPRGDQYFSFDRKRCVNRSNGRCKADIDCGTNYVCERNGNITFGRCMCREGLVADGPSRGCRLGFNATCKNEGECAYSSNLSCIEGQCRCGGAMMYSPESNRCVGLVGSPCGNSGGLFRNAGSCIANASCMHNSLIPGRLDLVAYCTCNFGFVETEQNTCAPAPTGFQPRIINGSLPTAATGNISALNLASTNGVSGGANRTNNFNSRV